MHSEVVAVVRELAAAGRRAFRASYVAERASVPVAAARRDLAALTQIGDLRMDLELMCPWSGDTVATFAEGAEIPSVFSSWECGDGEEFDVTPELIWVTFTPTARFLEELRADATARGEVSKPGGGKAQGPRRTRARATPMTCSCGISETRTPHSPT